MNSILQKIELAKMAVQMAKIDVSFTYAVVGETIEITFLYNNKKNQKKVKYYSKIANANAVENVLHYDIMNCFDLYPLYIRQYFVKKYFKKYAYFLYLERNNLNFEVEIDNLLV